MQEQRFRRQSPASRLKLGEGQIVQVQGGGRILRSIGRKDRHSKVCTARGPRERRLRLSATTAIRFYDLQDRLGHGRPSDAIDWLMKEAKAAIDALHEFPPAARKPEQDLHEQSHGEDENQIQHSLCPSAACPNFDTSLSYKMNPTNYVKPVSWKRSVSDSLSHDVSFKNYIEPIPQNDTLPKSVSESLLHDMSLKNYIKFTPSNKYVSESVFSVGTPSIFLYQNPMGLQNHLNVISPSEPALFSASASLNFETTPTTNWFNPETTEIGQSQRVFNWGSNSNSGINGEGREGGLAIDSLPRKLHRILGQDQVFSQGGTLQSSCSPSFRALTNPTHSDLNYDQVAGVNPSLATGNAFAGDGFSGFFGSPRVQGEEEKVNPVPNKPASASCVLHYQD